MFNTIRHAVRVVHAHVREHLKRTRRSPRAATFISSPSGTESVIVLPGAYASVWAICAQIASEKVAHQTRSRTTMRINAGHIH